MGQIRVAKKKNKALTVILPVQLIKQPENNFASETFSPSVFHGKLKNTLAGHDSEIFYVKLIDRSSVTRHPSPLIISASHDKTIKIWNPYSGKLLKTLNGHHGGVWSLDIHEDKIVSCSTDKTIRIWDINSGKLLVSLLGHQNHVYSVIVSNSMIISSSLDKTVKFRGFNTKKLIKVIESPESSIWTLCVYNDHLIGGSGDGTLKIWSLSDYLLKDTIKLHDDSITSVKVYDGKIITSSKDKSIKITDSGSLEVIHILKGHKSSVWTVDARDGKIVSGSDDRTVKIWDMEEGKLIETLQGHTEWVSSVSFGENFMISASGDNTLKIWEKLPLHNCNTIDFSFPNVEKNPFETENEFEQKKQQTEKKLFSKILAYDYINIGNVELLADSYSTENDTLPVRVTVQCKKISDFSKVPVTFLTSIKISRFRAERFYKTGIFHNLYIKYYRNDEKLEYVLYTAFESVRYKLDPEIVITEDELNKKTDLKTGRIDIFALPVTQSESMLTENPKHDCNSITTTDTFRTPFENPDDFYKRVSKKLTAYGYINVGKVEMIATEFNIEAQEFPLQVNVACDKILNITELKKGFKSKIKINRYSARDLFEDSKVHNLYIRYTENDNKLYYQLSVHFNGVAYFLH